MSGERQRPGFRDGLTHGGSLCLDAAGSKQGRDKAKRVATRFSAELWAKSTMTSVSAEAKWAGGCEFLVECRTWPRREYRLSHADRPDWRRAECTGAQQTPTSPRARHHSEYLSLTLDDGVGRMAGVCSRTGVPRGRLRLAREQCDWEKTGMSGRALHPPSPWRYVKGASAATARLLAA